jgi:cob(I)alamin adenosyltransferase
MSALSRIKLAEMERLRAEIERLREALQKAEEFIANWDDQGWAAYSAARAALSGKGET